MSRLDEIKEQIKNMSNRILEKIQETETYTQMQDRYQSLSASSQRLVWILGASLVAFIILFYPLSQISSSSGMIASFEEKRNLIRDLYKTYRESSNQSGLQPPPASDSLRNAVETVLTSANLIPDQRTGMIQSTVEGRLIPSSLVNHVLEVKLAKLNLKHIVDIGTSIVAISDSVKMKDMSINANASDTRYYDVTYKLYSLNIPEPTPEPPPEIDTKSKRPKKDSDSAEDTNK